MLEDPPHARAASGRITRDDELLGRVRAAFAVDPQALLDLQRAFGGAELPERPAAHAQQRTSLVGSQARRNIAPEVKAHREALVTLASRARGGKQTALAPPTAPARAVGRRGGHEWGLTGRFVGWPNN